MARNKPDEGNSEWGPALLREAEAVKRLILLLLVKLGTSSEELGMVLGVDPSAIRRMAPSRKIRKLPIGETKEND